LFIQGLDLAELSFSQFAQTLERLEEQLGRWISFGHRKIAKVVLNVEHHMRMAWMTSASPSKTETCDDPVDQSKHGVMAR